MPVPPPQTKSARFADLESVYATKIEAWRAALGLSNEGWPGGAAGAN